MMTSRTSWFVLAGVVGVGMTAVLLILPGTGRAQPSAPSSTTATLPIATVATNNEMNAAAAYDEARDRYLVVNQNNTTLNGTCITSDGDTVRTYVIGNGQNPDVVYNIWEDQYLVVWEDSGDIEGAYVSGTCCAQVGCNSVPFPVSSDRPGYEGRPAVAYNHHSSHRDYLVVWMDDGNTSSHWAVYARQVTSTTIPGSSFAIKDDSSAYHFEPDVAYNLNMNEYLVVYTRDASKGLDQDARDVYGRRVKNSGGIGLLAENPIDTSSNSQDEPAVAAYRLNYTSPYLVVFRDHWNDAAGDIRGYMVYTTGMSSQLVNISTASGVPEHQPAIASNETMGGYVVAWSYGGPNCDIHGRRLSPTGAVQPTFVVSAWPADEQHVAVAGGVPVPFAAWQSHNGADWDVYGRFLYSKTFLPLVLRDYP
jgi:hypothetical protein